MYQDYMCLVISLKQLLHHLSLRQMETLKTAYIRLYCPDILLQIELIRIYFIFYFLFLFK